MILVKHNNNGKLKPYFYFALEEYIMKNLLKDDKQFFFTWRIKGVVIGKHQVLENEVNFDYLKENDIDLYRRPSGGGTIYADENNTMFSFVVKKDEKIQFKPYLNLVIEAMDKLGLDIKFSGRNDLLFEDKKISGVAFLQNKFGFLIHGTFMYDVDIETMIRSITPNDEKLVSKGIDSVRSRVVNLKDYLDGLSHDELIDHLEKEITTETYVLSKEEENIINELASKYEDKNFRFWKQPPYTKQLSKRFSGGHVNITLNLRYGEIENAKITGDFFDLFPVEIIEEKLVGTPFKKEPLTALIKDLPIESIIVDVTKDEFLDLLLSGTIE